MILVTQHSPPRHDTTALTCTAFLRLFEVESLAPFFLRSKKGKSRRHSFVSFSHVRHFIPHPSHFALTFHIYISFKSSSLGRLRSLVTENERVHRSTVKFTRSHFFRLTDVGSIVSTNSIEHVHIWFAICSWHHTSSKEGIISQVPKLRLPPEEIGVKNWTTRTPSIKMLEVMLEAGLGGKRRVRPAKFHAVPTSTHPAAAEV